MLELYFYVCFRSNMTEALEWLIEHQDDSDDEENDETDFLLADTTTDPNIAGPSSLARTKKSLKDACIELFEAGNFCGTKLCITCMYICVLSK